jgi:hypothetical protein
LGTPLAPLFTNRRRITVPEATIFEPERKRLLAVRDELRLQIHLAGAELRDRFDELEHEWRRLEGRLSLVGDVAREEANDVGEAAQLLLDEIREGYEHIRARL